MDDYMSVTVISCLYGKTHDRYLPEWINGISTLDPAPAEVILSTDKGRFIPQVNEITHRQSGGWKYPQAFHLTKALGHVTTDWVWVHDVDDIAFPWALEGLEDVQADVLQMGYVRSDGEVYLPPVQTAEEVIANPKNEFVSSSCVRTDVLRRVGGFPDCALQDWALWIALAHAGATFDTTDRPRFYYRRHHDARGERELTPLERDTHMAEMGACLAVAI